MKNFEILRNEYFERLRACSNVTGFIIFEPNITRYTLKVIFNPETEEEIKSANNLLTFWSDVCSVYTDTMNRLTPVDYQENICIDSCVDIINASKNNTQEELLERLSNEVDPSFIARFIYDKYRAFTADSDLALEVVSERCGYNPFDTSSKDFRPYMYDAEYLIGELIEKYFNLVQAMDTEEEKALSTSIINEFHRLYEQNRQRS